MPVDASRGPKPPTIGDRRLLGKSNPARPDLPGEANARPGAGEFERQDGFEADEGAGARAPVAPPARFKPTLKKRLAYLLWPRERRSDELVFRLKDALARADLTDPRGFLQAFAEAYEIAGSELFDLQNRIHCIDPLVEALAANPTIATLGRHLLTSAERDDGPGLDRALAALAALGCDSAQAPHFFRFATVSREPAMVSAAKSLPQSGNYYRGIMLSHEDFDRTLRCGLEVSRQKYREAHMCASPHRPGLAASYANEGIHFRVGIPRGNSAYIYELSPDSPGWAEPSGPHAFEVLHRGDFPPDQIARVWRFDSEESQWEVAFARQSEAVTP